MGSTREKRFRKCVKNAVLKVLKIFLVNVFLRRKEIFFEETIVIDVVSNVSFLICR